MSQTIAAIATTIGIIATGIVWYLRQRGGRKERLNDEIVKLQQQRDEISGKMDIIFRSRPFNVVEYGRLNGLRESLNRRIARLRAKLGDSSRRQ